MAEESPRLVDSTESSPSHYGLTINDTSYVCEVRTAGGFEDAKVRPGDWALIFFAKPSCPPEVAVSSLAVARFFGRNGKHYSWLYLMKYTHSSDARLELFAESAPAPASHHWTLISQQYAVGAQESRGRVEALAVVKRSDESFSPEGYRPYAMCIQKTLQTILQRYP